jgi:hypothetical protein
MTPDASVPTGHVIRMRNGARRGFYIYKEVGSFVHNGDALKIVIRHRNPTPLSGGSWRWALMREDTSNIANDALPVSTGFVTTTVNYTLSGFSNGQAIIIGIVDAGANAGLDIDSMTISVCAPNIADTNGATLRELEVDVNRLKALLRSANQMAG